MPPGDPEALAQALLNALNLGATAREAVARRAIGAARPAEAARRREQASSRENKRRAILLIAFRIGWERGGLGASKNQWTDNAMGG